MTENDKHLIRVAMRAAEIESRVTQEDVEHIDEVLAATYRQPCFAEIVEQCAIEVESMGGDNCQYHAETLRRRLGGKNA